MANTAVNITFRRKAYDSVAQAIAASTENSGSIIFDDTSKCIFVNGITFGSNVADVIYTDGVLTITYQSGSTSNVNLKIDDGTITIGDNSIKVYSQVEVDNKISVLTNDHTVFKVEMTDTTATIAPNTFYVWGTVDELDITLATPKDETIYNEYMFQFASGSEATTLTLPDNLTWYMNNNTVLANKTYQVSIVNNLAILGEF